MMMWTKVLFTTNSNNYRGVLIDLLVGYYQLCECYLSRCVTVRREIPFLMEIV